MSKTMIVASTGQQTVNILPAIMEKIDRIYIISNPNIKENTKRLEKILNDRKIETEIFEIDEKDENYVEKLSEKVLDLIEKCNSDEIYVNYSGGQKTTAIGFYDAYIKCKKDNVILIYVDGNTKICSKKIKSNGQYERAKIFSDLNIKEILYLFGYELFEEEKVVRINDKSFESKLKLGESFYNFYKNDENFRQIFLTVGKVEKYDSESVKDLIRKTVNELVTDNLEELNIDKNIKNEGVKEFHNLIKNGEIYKIKKNLKISVLLNEYIVTVRNLIRDYIEKRLEKIDYRVLDKKLNETDKNKLYEIFQTLGGEIKFNNDGCLYSGDVKFPCKLGDIFEYAVAYRVYDIINKNKNIKDNILDVLVNLKTKRSESKENKCDSEKDIVIVTKFGTLIIIEAKSGNYEGDTAKSKEYQAIKESGSYAKAFICGPIIDELYVNKSNNKFKDYVSGTIKNHKESAKVSGIDYCQIDELENYLGKILR